MDVTGKDALIYALDAEGMDDARRWVGLLKDSVGVFKIGFQLFLREGPAVVRMVQDSGARVFLDLKFHDIPHTVGKAAAEAVKMGVYMFNVHASGGRDMMEQAVRSCKAQARELGAEPPVLLAVTVLTSLDDHALRAIGFPATPAEMVRRFCEQAKAAGMSGVVASPAEAEAIRKHHGPGFTIVCPGVRPAGASKGDQARVATPKDAIAAGADHLVVGRPIRDAEDPAAAARAILEEILAAKGAA